LEGGDEEEDEYDKYNSAVNTDRAINSTDIKLETRRKKKGKKRRRKNSQADKDQAEQHFPNEQLETQAPVEDLEANNNQEQQEQEGEGEEEGGKKKKKKKEKKRKRKRVRKHVSVSKISGRRLKAPEDRKKRDHRNPNDLYFFSRMWRDIGNKW
jgi:hypothetical protein